MKIGKARIEVVHGDITKIPVEAVVNPANDMLWMGGGVSALIRKAGGKSIEEEALRHSPVKIGDAVVTGAGNLSARRVIHAVIAGQDLTVSESSIRSAVKASLVQAESDGCTSIAIPMLTTDISHIEIHKTARFIVGETVDYLITINKTMEYVVFVVEDETVQNIVKDALMEIFTKHA